MAELDYALICDYVRLDLSAGLAHVIGAGITFISKESVPSGHNLGLLVRIGFARNECGRPHRLELIFQDADGAVLMQANANAQPVWMENSPGGRVNAQIGLNIGLPLPRYGDYSLEIVFNDNLIKTIPLRVVPPQPPTQMPPGLQGPPGV